MHRVTEEERETQIGAQSYRGTEGNADRCTELQRKRDADRCTELQRKREAADP